MAIDALVGGLVAGGADAGAAAAGVGAADLGAAAGAADVGAFGAATGADLAAAAAPDLAAADAGAAGLAAADTTFGAFDPALFAANSADVAAGGFGVDLTGAGALGSDLGAGAGLDAANAAFGTFSPDVFAGNIGDVATGGFGTDVGGASSFADIPGATDVPAGATGSWMDYPGGVPAQQLGGTQGFGAAGQDTGPMVSSEASGQGIVDPGSSMDQTFNQFTTTDQGASLPTDMANRVGATAVPTQSTTLESAFPGATQGIVPNTPTSFSAPVGTDFSGTSMFNTGGLVPGTGTEAAPADFSASLTPGATQTSFTPGGFDTGISTANVAPSAQMIAGAPDVVPTAAAPSPVLPSATTVGPGTVGTPAATGAATAAAGGTDALTALRAGTLGVNAITAGINLSNALNQPSYGALLPSAYPGSPYQPPLVGQYSGSTPLANSNYPGGMAPVGQQYENFLEQNPLMRRSQEILAGMGGGYFDQFGRQHGGPAGGMAASRLTAGLLANESPQQLAQTGIISPAQATNLQGTYNGIAAQYARELGVSASTLSPGVKQMIAAQALADSGLGGH